MKTAHVRQTQTRLGSPPQLLNFAETRVTVVLHSNAEDQRDANQRFKPLKQNPLDGVNKSNIPKKKILEPSSFPVDLTPSLAAV